MCVVSMVMDQWWPKWPTDPTNPLGLPYTIPAQPYTIPTAPVNPAPTDMPGTMQIPPPPTNTISWEVVNQDPKLAEMMLEVLNKLEAIDKRMGLMEQCLVSASEKKKVKTKLRRIAKKSAKKSVKKKKA